MASRVLTFARIRPALDREVDEHRLLNRCVAKQPDQSILHVATKPGAPVVIEADGSTSNADVRSFEFDGCFTESCHTSTVYESVGRSFVDCVLSGVNATLMCYGMTGSGKTHTMLGEKGSADGLVGLAALQLLSAAAASNGTITLEVGFVQLYGTVATDLLVDCANAVPLRITRRDAEVMLEGQTRWPVATSSDVTSLIAKGCARRKVASQKLNSASSRSHALVTFFVSVQCSSDENTEANSDDDSVMVRCSKLVCVDLAGSERVKESGVTGLALKEAMAINLSLFHLIRVVQCLHSNEAGGNTQRVPHADSPLTMLLSDALGGDCKTAVIATLSPSQQHASQTLGSCSFAAACRCVRNGAARVAAHRIPRSRPWASSDASAEAAKRKCANNRAQVQATLRLPWAGVQPGDPSSCPGSRSIIAGVSCLIFGLQGAAPLPIAVALHGNPSDAEAMSWLAPALVHAGFLVVCPDMPGFGHSPPRVRGRLGTRSEHACDSGGPADIVQAVLHELSAPSATLIGYDWGAGIALAMAASAKHKRFVHKVVCMHPAYAKERVPNELKTVQASTLIMWAEDNAFHSWPRFKPLAAKLKQRLGEGRYAEYRTRRETDAAWSANARARAMVKFLTGVDPLPEAQTVPTRPVCSAVAADGSRITRSDGVVFRSEVTEEMVRGRDTEAAACAALVDAERAGEMPRILRELARAGGNEKAAAMARFARALPQLDDSTITPVRLHNLGLWSERACEAAQRLQARIAGTPRYFAGRQVLVPGGVRAIGVLRAVDQLADCAVVTVATRERTVEHTVSWCALLKLNQRHVLPSTVAAGGAIVLRLEDGMWADLSSALLRAELAYVALALDGVFAIEIAAALELDDDDALDRARGAAVCAMRACLDVTSFARDGGADRGRDRERYAKDDVAKMAAHGEGHCRTCSSCLAPFLWCFAELLGIDPHYCTNAAASHQWLQYDARPSMRSYSCDLYHDELSYQSTGHRGGRLSEPVTVAYAPSSLSSGQLFPQDEPLLLGGRPVQSAPLGPTDVALGCDASDTSHTAMADAM